MSSLFISRNKIQAEVIVHFSSDYGSICLIICSTISANAAQ